MQQLPSPLKDLISQLSAMEDAPIDPERVATTLHDSDVTADDIRPLLRFHSERYTRNLMYRSETFDVIALCWPPDLESPVHNHRDQMGWVRVLEGALDEIRYSTEGQPEQMDEDSIWKPEVFNHKRLPAGRSVAAVNKEHGIHQLASLDRPSISLHIYSKPHESCLVFNRRDGRIRRKKLTYDSTPTSRAKQFS